MLKNVQVSYITQQVDLPEKGKEKINLFFISYTCNELISKFLNKLNKRGFNYKTIYEFYYTVLGSYNKAINGFEELSKEIKNKKNALKIYSELKKEGMGKPPETKIFYKEP